MDKKKYPGIFIPYTSVYLWTILVMVIAITILNWLIALPGYLLLAIMVYYNFRSNYRRQKGIAGYIENLTFSISSASKETLLNFPMPLVVVELDGTIIWHNSSFRNIFDGKENLEENIKLFISIFQPGDTTREKVNISRDIDIGSKHYKVLGNFIKTDGRVGSGNYILLLFFIDNSELDELKKRYLDEKIAVGIIIIDNYDELMQSMEDAGRPQMLAEIEKKIVQWMSFTEGILKKFERDKYLFLFELAHLKEMEDKKFEILDSVKEINIGNKIPVTLSMGFGINGKTLLGNFRFADASIDIALGRGGDQVVMKNADAFSFFGGKTRELEKRTRVKARVIAYALRELIDDAAFVMIMGHENADIDLLGSALGLYRITKNRGKEAFIVLNRVNPTIESLILKIQKNVEYKDIFLNNGEALSRINSRTLLIIVDTHRAVFTETPELLKHTGQVVVIDHHRKGTDFIQDAVLTYQETYASSTSELVAEILQYVDEKPGLKPVEAEALYAGIVVDTNNFTFKTGVRTFEAASFLRKQGVDTISVRQLFQNDLATYSNISDIVKDAEIINGNIAISACPPNTKNALLIAAKAADELLSLSGVVAAFVLCIIDNQVSISGRSFGELNVQVILEKLGGGGHLTVAGAQLGGITMEDAKGRLKEAILSEAVDTV